MRAVRELIYFFRAFLQGVQRRRYAGVLRRDYITVIHLFCGFSGLVNILARTIPELPGYGHEPLYLFRFVIEFSVDLCTADCPIIP